MALERLAQLKKNMEEEVKELLAFWEKYSVEKNGIGFYGAVSAKLEPVQDAHKLLVLSSRLVWTFSAAYRILGECRYKNLAQRAYDYFIAHFIDREYGGAFWELHSSGKVYDESKRIYGEAFAIYSLSEYYRVFGDEQALNQAISIYQCLEQYAYDKEYGGYYEILTRQWGYEQDKQKSNINPHNSACKTMNTHLHLLEAYTGLYRVWKDDGLKGKLCEQIKTMVEKIVDRENWHYKLYFDRSWNSVTPEISYGHDIEGSWLLLEAAEVTGDAAIVEYVLPVTVKMAEAVYNEGWHKDGGILYEAEPHGITNASRSWWVQSEVVVGFFNAWKITGEIKYLDAVDKICRFINDEIIDHVNGGWFTFAVSDNLIKNRIDGWTCPYHNARMYFEIMERIHAAEM